MTRHETVWRTKLKDTESGVLCCSSNNPKRDGLALQKSSRVCRVCSGMVSVAHNMAIQYIWAGHLRLFETFAYSNKWICHGVRCFNRPGPEADYFFSDNGQRSKFLNYTAEPQTPKCPALRVHYQSWALSVFFAIFNTKKWFVCIFINLITYFCTSPI